MNKNQLLLATLWILSLAGTYWLARDTHPQLEDGSQETILLQTGYEGANFDRKWSAASPRRRHQRRHRYGTHPQSRSGT